MRRRVLFIAVLAAALVACSAAPALAAVHGPMVPMAVFGIDFPSVKEIVGDVVRFFFSTLLDALVPDWLKDGSVRVIRRLVTIPNPTDARAWPTLAQLSEGMRWIALPLLSLAVVASWVQQWLRETTGRPGSVAVVLPRTVLALLLLVAYPTVVANAVALVNSITNAMLSLPAVEQGLERTVGLVFAGTLLSGSGVLLALLGIAAVVLAVGLFMLSVGLLVIFSVAFVSAPLAIACSVLDETRGVWTAWRFTLLSAALIPVGWCVLFATAGAFMLDMTSWSGGVAGTIGSRFVGVFGALIVLGLAVRWPLMLWSSIRAHLGGALVSVGRTAAGGRGGMVAGAGGRTARAALQRTGLRAGDAVTGALGATRARAVTSARMALADGARLAARVPGVGSASAAVGTAGAAIAARPAPAAAVQAVKRGTQQARAHGRAGAHAARSAYAAGASAPQAAAAGVAVAASRPARSRSAALETGGREGGSLRERTGAPAPSRTSSASRTSRSASTRRQPDGAGVASPRTGAGSATRALAIASTRPYRQGGTGAVTGSRRLGPNVASPGRVPAASTAARPTGPVDRPPASAPGPTAAERPAMPSSAPPRRRAPSGTAPPSSGRRADRASGRARRKGS